MDYLNQFAGLFSLLAVIAAVVVPIIPLSRICNPTA